MDKEVFLCLLMYIFHYYKRTRKGVGIYFRNAFHSSISLSRSLAIVWNQSYHYERDMRVALFGEADYYFDRLFSLE